MRKSWQLDRRTVLRGAGVSLALPALEGMVSAAPGEPAARPRRMCCMLFPYGVAMPEEESSDRQWGWFPQGEGKDYRLTKVLQPLRPLISDVSILSGLSHPECRQMGGHLTGDTFLTGTELKEGSFRNSVSLDQYAARYVGLQTRLSSLVLSSDGGIGPRSTSTTLSYTDKGQPIPALSDPKLIFKRLFERGNANEKRQLQNADSILDMVRDQSRSLRSKLGKPDQRKLDEYETAVRQVEQRMERAQKWLSVPLPEVDPGTVSLDADPEGPKEYIRAIYDLMFLAFQTDTTRLATYQLGSFGSTIARRFPTALGINKDWHRLAHDARSGKEEGFEQMGRFDQFLTEQLAYFIGRLKETPEGDGSLLDQTVLLYGSSNSKTHVNRNYPLVLAGGRSLGLKHDHYLKYEEDVPLSNLFVSILQSLGVETDRFADSTGTLNGIT